MSASYSVVHHVPVFDTTLRKTHMWLSELVHAGICREQAQAYSILRAVLHALRDRLIPDEAVHLGAQLPMLLRGAYYEGWKPSVTPTVQRTRAAFLDDLRDPLNHISGVDAEQAVKGVLALLNHHISSGQIEDVAHMLPSEIRDLWPPVDDRPRGPELPP